MPASCATTPTSATPRSTNDEVAWCAAFLGACLERAGVASTRSLMARSYLDWGEPLARSLATGAVAVLSRSSDPSLGHVGFLVGETAADIILLGGNQGDAVTVQAFPRSRSARLSLARRGATRHPGRRISADPGPSHRPVFERALTHVLEMEGGYDDDPYDPGGPTNLGITLAEFARDKGLELTAANFAAMKAELKAIPRDTVRAHLPRRATGTPPPAPSCRRASRFFHFDAAVNQGVAGAARMLQQAVGAEVDGEIGPLTLAAVAQPPRRGNARRSTPRSAAGATARCRRSGASAKAGSPASTPRWRSPTPSIRSMPAPRPLATERPSTHAHRNRLEPDHTASRRQVVGQLDDHLGHHHHHAFDRPPGPSARFSASTSRPS